jgi:hypothetical protein
MVATAGVMAVAGGIRDRIMDIITAGLMMVVTAEVTPAAEMVVVGIDETDHVDRAKGRRLGWTGPHWLGRAVANFPVLCVSRATVSEDPLWVQA